MNPTFIFLAILGVLWIGGGSIWLLSNRNYRIAQIPQFLMDLMGFPVEYTQKLFGNSGVPYALLMPNMIIFGTFTFVPLILNFYTSLTAGEQINIMNRPYVGLENYASLFDCESIFRPKSCGNDGNRFWSGMYTTILFVVIQVPILVVVSLMTALVLNSNIKNRGFWRAVFFYPVMLSPVVIANIWIWVLHRKGGLNTVLRTSSDAITELSGVPGFDAVFTIILAILLIAVGERVLRNKKEPSFAWAFLFGALFLAVFIWARPASLISENPNVLNLLIGVVICVGFLWMVSRAHASTRYAVFGLSIVAAILLLTIQFDAVFDLGRYRPVNWLVTPNSGWPMFWLVFVYTWSHMGFFMLIILAGLQAIPTDLYEAAKMDATKPVRVFTKITLPLIMPTVTVVVILSLIRCFQIFDDAYLLTGGGPGSETKMVVQNIFETAFIGEDPNYGMASAGSVLMGIVIAMFTAVQLFVTRRQSEL